MFSDSESTGGSSESRSLDSESISPGTVTKYLSLTENSVKDEMIRLSHLRHNRIYIKCVYANPASRT